MIWSIVSKEEMNGFGTNQVFRFYREAIGKNNISLAVVSEDDKLEFVHKEDTILLRTANKKLLDTIRENGLRSTAESLWAYEMVKDKANFAKFLSMHGIVVPKQYNMDEVDDSKTYFVKPRFGSDSFGISNLSVCYSKDMVREQVECLKQMDLEPIIEDYIEGVDCTVACVRYQNPSGILACAIEVECEETNGIQTRDCKVGFKECCSRLDNTEIKEIASNVFKALKLEHHARIDFRMGLDGKFYLIDVNLLPGLGPIDHYAKCLLLDKNMSYTDALRTIINSAS